MKVLLEDATASSFESIPIEKGSAVNEQAKPPPTRGVKGHHSFSSLDLSSQRPGSPRSTLLHHNNNDTNTTTTTNNNNNTNTTSADAEDGVIVTCNPRKEKMTRRHSMSRLFGTPSRSNGSDIPSSGGLVAGSGTPSSFEEVSQMRPGLKRRGSLRAALQQKMNSDDSLKVCTVHTTTTNNNNNSNSIGGNTTTSTSTARPRMRQFRRNSVGVCGRMVSSPALLHSEVNRTGSGRNLGNTSRANGSGRNLGNSRAGSGRGLLHRTMSFRKQDSLREWNPNTVTVLMTSSHNSCRSIGTNGSFRGTSGSGGGGSNNSRRTGMKKQSSLAELMVDCNTTVSVSNTWASVRRVSDYQRRLGEQVLFMLIELEPQTARTSMRLESFFSDRFTQLCRVLVDTIDMVVTLLGPDLDEASPELARLGQACRQDGINTWHLGDAVSVAVDKLLGDDVTPDMVKAWKITFDSLRRRLALEPSSSSSSSLAAA